MFCANCGRELEERGCKVRCRCGYFEDCSDPSAPGEWGKIGMPTTPDVPANDPASTGDEAGTDR